MGEYSWEPSTLEPEAKEEDQEKEGPKVKPGHRLLIKSAILMPTAKENEVTVVQIESECYKGKTVTVPICAMKGGVDLQKYVDLLVRGPSKMKIIHGEGPIHLIGSHCVDYMGLQEEESEDEDEDEGEDENEMETEEAKEDSSKAKNKSGDKKASPAKDEKKEEEKKQSPEKSDKKVTPSKEDSKKRKASGDPKSAEKKAKN